MANGAWVIANPAAGRGVSRAKRAALREQFHSLGVENFVETTSPGHEESLADRALEESASVIVVVGGDGTCGRVAARILARRSDCGIGVIPAGTGNDFAKTLGLTGLRTEDAVRLALRERAVKIDVGRAGRHYFLNSCGFGFDASVLKASNDVRWLKGSSVYMYAALAQLFSYRGVGVSGDDSPLRSKLMITVSNGRYVGGAFRIAPHASVVDGLLDVNYFDNCGVIDRIRAFVGAVRGTHQRLPMVTAERRKILSLTFADPPLMEVDGELHRASSSSVRIECLPRALSVIAAPNAVL